MQEHKNILVKLLEYGSNESQAPSTYVGNWILSKKFDFYLKPKKADFINKSKIGLKRSTIVRKYYFQIEKYFFFHILQPIWNCVQTAASSFHQKNSFSKINNPWPWLPSWFFPKTWSHLPWLHTKIPPFFFLLLAIILLFTKTFGN